VGREVGVPLPAYTSLLTRR